MGKQHCERYERLRALVKKPAGIARIEISHWSEFFRLLNFFTRREEGGWQWIFRGQRDANWGFLSSLERDIENYRKWTTTDIPRRELSEYIEDVVLDERRMIYEFRNLVKGSDYLPAGMASELDESLVQNLAVLQHYGSKTRLLDFTYSFVVAAYFAYEERSTKKPRSIWALNIDSLVGRIPRMMEDLNDNSPIYQRMRQYASGSRAWPEDITRDFQREFVSIADKILEGKKTYDSGVIPIRLAGNNRRLDAQNGLFLFPQQVFPFEENLARALGCKKEDIENLKNPQGKTEKIGERGMHTSKYKDYSLLKIDFAPEMEARAWYVLDQMQMVPRMLFPDLEGLAKGMRIKYS